MKLGDKIGIIPDNFIEIMKKEAPKLPTPPLPSREEPPPVSRPPPPEKKEEVSVHCIHLIVKIFKLHSWFYIVCTAIILKYSNKTVDIMTF